MKYSQRVEAVQQRIRRLPKLYKDYMYSARKRDAKECIDLFQRGISHQLFKFEALKDETVKRKERLGYAQPATPLYGLGYEGAHTYIKGLRYFKTSKGYVVRMTGKHHDSKLDNHALLLIHEYGCNLSNGGRIPARPALHEAYNEVLRGIKKRDGALVKRINKYLRSGQW